VTERKIYRLKISNIKRINPYPPIKPIEPIISQQALRQPLINPIIPKNQFQAFQIKVTAGITLATSKPHQNQ